MSWDIELEHLYVSPGHNYRGRHGLGSESNPIEDREVVQCVARRGIEGDRYFDRSENFKGQITFFEAEVYEAVKEKFALPDLEASAFRRNVIVRGVALADLIGRNFTLQDLAFEGVEEAAPCYWMNEACAEGVEEFLKGKGGMRARITQGGELKRGSGTVEIVP